MGGITTQIPYFNSGSNVPPPFKKPIEDNARAEAKHTTDSADPNPKQLELKIALLKPGNAYRMQVTDKMKKEIDHLIELKKEQSKNLKMILSLDVPLSLEALLAEQRDEKYEEFRASCAEAEDRLKRIDNQIKILENKIFDLKNNVDVVQFTLTKDLYQFLQPRKKEKLSFLETEFRKKQTAFEEMEVLENLSKEQKTILRNAKIALQTGFQKIADKTKRFTIALSGDESSQQKFWENANVDRIIDKSCYLSPQESEQLASFIEQIKQGG